jgi:hypothetical protein
MLTQERVQMLKAAAYSLMAVAYLLTIIEHVIKLLG